ncbi:hypothetical protein ZOSMA_89G00600 [Zostera marina]|uniref:HMA domain-containing protein n=1 Tax=Zostera marina TaxID=29655 RepID=A0A0K9NM15_ZOSMR|nr:hypothetical protein ZOSMA_89G00600 [Zostera marina]
MESSDKQTLRFAENLTLPSEQVIVLKASLNCDHCRYRMSQLVSKMNRLMDCVIDLHGKEVILRGDFDVQKKRRKKSASMNLIWSFLACSNCLD